MCSTCNLTLISISTPVITSPASTIHTHRKKFSLSATYFPSIWKDFYKTMNVNSSLASGWQSIMESSRNIYIIIMIFFLLRRWDVCTSGHQFNLLLHSLCVRKLPQCENNAKCILICSPKRKESYIYPALSPIAVMTIYKWISHCSFWPWTRLQQLRSTEHSEKNFSAPFRAQQRGKAKTIHIVINWFKGSLQTRKAIPI